ncbi:hypothetical protein B0H34DRAFT_677926 [Crassisporium funariophilum]|nr:hypothetical protein B0H34DRAFT_677926 [Crassisporium funariophilum]
MMNSRLKNVYNGNPIPTAFSQANAIAEALHQKRIHFATEVTVIGSNILCKDPRKYVTKPYRIPGSCKQESCGDDGLTADFKWKHVMKLGPILFQNATHHPDNADWEWNSNFEGKGVLRDLNGCFIKQTFELQAIAALMYERLEEESLAKVPITDSFPYCSKNGDAGFVCEKDRAVGNLHCIDGLQTCSLCPNLKIGAMGGQDLLKHMGTHILNNVRLRGADSPCVTSTWTLNISDGHSSHLALWDLDSEELGLQETTGSTPAAGCEDFQNTDEGEHKALQPALDIVEDDDWDAPSGIASPPHASDIYRDEPVDVESSHRDLKVAGADVNKDWCPPLRIGSPPYGNNTDISVDVEDVVNGGGGGVPQATSHCCQKRKTLPDSDDVVLDGDDMCQDDGCGRLVATDDYLSCKGPGCGGVYHLTCQGLTKKPTKDWYCDNDCKTNTTGASTKKWRQKKT